MCLCLSSSSPVLPFPLCSELAACSWPLCHRSSHTWGKQARSFPSSICFSHQSFSLTKRREERKNVCLFSSQVQPALGARSFLPHCVHRAKSPGPRLSAGDLAERCSVILRVMGRERPPDSACCGHLCLRQEGPGLLDMDCSSRAALYDASAWHPEGCCMCVKSPITQKPSVARQRPSRTDT